MDTNSYILIAILVPMWSYVVYIWYDMFGKKKEVYHKIKQGRVTQADLDIAYEWWCNLEGVKLIDNVNSIPKDSQLIILRELEKREMYEKCAIVKKLINQPIEK